MKYISWELEIPREAQISNISLPNRANLNLYSLAEPEGT